MQPLFQSPAFVSWIRTVQKVSPQGLGPSGVVSDFADGGAILTFAPPCYAPPTPPLPMATLAAQTASTVAAFSAQARVGLSVLALATDGSVGQPLDGLAPSGTTSVDHMVDLRSQQLHTPGVPLDETTSTSASTTPGRGGLTPMTDAAVAKIAVPPKPHGYWNGAAAAGGVSPGAVGFAFVDAVAMGATAVVSSPTSDGAEGSPSATVLPRSGGGSGSGSGSGVHSNAPPCIAYSRRESLSQFHIAGGGACATAPILTASLATPSLSRLNAVVNTLKVAVPSARNAALVYDIALLLHDYEDCLSQSRNLHSLTHDGTAQPAPN